jgi:curli biogenesis system outer membrane secretion channel CsgG
MIPRIPIVAALLAGAALSAHASGLEAQTRKIAVLTFDQSQVQGGFRETFGRADVNIGRSLANFLASRLGQSPGVEIVEVSGAIPFTMDPGSAAAAGRSVGADAVIAGSIMLYGSESGTAGVRGPSVGGIRLGAGRRTTVAAVSLEARLVDVASAQLIGVFPAQQTASRSGLALFAQVPGIISSDGIIDMTRDDFQRSLLGEATTATVTALLGELRGSLARIGTMAAPAPAAPAAVAVAAPVAPGPVVPAGPVAMPTGPLAWVPYQFRGTERFRYAVTRTEGRTSETGFYQLDLEPAGTGQSRMRVQSQLGSDASSSTLTVPTGQGAGGQPMMSMGMGQLMAMGPLGMVLFNPTGWMFLYGRQLSVGDEWSTTSDGETVSVRVESTCSHAGVGGYKTVMRQNNQVRHESCLAQGVALPTRVLIVDDDTRIEMTLTEYRP